ncbi:MAG: hypothetical protein SOT07_09325 [Paludibacteraceae bacterium]|nr:hypothetical protein [Paludibacteraceae bacterium]
MIDFLDFLNNHVLGGNDGAGGMGTSAMKVMQDYAQQHLGFNLPPDEIVQSVQDASTFFNIGMPAEIHYGQMTGVCNHMADTMADDVLYISPKQMSNMNITQQDAFDLVMTHECAHRALQGINTHFNDHQEELCCDMLAGVRAGLNPDDLSMKAINAMKDSLRNTQGTASHPAGADRVAIIDEGVKFAQAYYDEHQCAPSLYECIDHFNELQGLQGDHAVNDIHQLVTLRPDDAPEAVKAYSSQEINNRVHKAERDMEHWKAEWESHLKLARHDMWRESEMAHARSCQRKYEEAKQAYNHWRNEKPDDFKGYTGDDIEWLEKQVRISSGIEQAHWLDKLDWARSHVHGFVSAEDVGADAATSDVPDKGFVDDISFGSGFSEEQPMFTYEQLLEAGFSEPIAHNILNTEMPHSYSQQELHDVLYSDNPLESYNRMMEEKAQAAINRADELEARIGRDFGVFAIV